MLSTSHNRAYQDFLTLLTDLHNFLLDTQTAVDIPQVKQKFGWLERQFEQQILNLNTSDLRAEIVPRWQSIQTEIKREFKLLTTDILFLASARQNTTKLQRIKTIEQHLDKLRSYCQGMITDATGEGE